MAMPCVFWRGVECGIAGCSALRYAPGVREIDWGAFLGEMPLLGSKIGRGYLWYRGRLIVWQVFACRWLAV